MARPVWSGTLSFGLVSVPVSLYSGTSDKTPHFHQFERGTADRVRNKRVNERTGEEVDYDDIVKGAEVSGGDYVIVDPDELDAIAPGRSRLLEINEFVDVDEIDPRYYRPAEVDTLVGDATKAASKLGWKPKIRFKDLVHLMVDADLAEAKDKTKGLGK